MAARAHSEMASAASHRNMTIGPAQAAVRRWTARGLIPSVRIGGRVLYRVDEFQAALDEIEENSRKK